MVKLVLESSIEALAYPHLPLSNRFLPRKTKFNQEADEVSLHVHSGNGTDMFTKSQEKCQDTSSSLPRYPYGVFFLSSMSLEICTNFFFFVAV